MRAFLKITCVATVGGATWCFVGSNCIDLMAPLSNWISIGYQSHCRVRPQLTFPFIVSHECRAYEIAICEFKEFIRCDISAIEQAYSQVCL